MTPRADGGTHDPEELTLLCSAHHTAAHDGGLAISGTWSTGFVLRHSDGRAYGATQLDVERVAVLRHAFAALRGLGFRETETQQMLDRVRAELPAAADLEGVVKLALSRAPMSCVREDVVPYRRCA